MGTSCDSWNESHRTVWFNNGAWMSKLIRETTGGSSKLFKSYYGKKKKKEKKNTWAAKETDWSPLLPAADCSWQLKHHFAGLRAEDLYQRVSNAAIKHLTLTIINHIFTCSDPSFTTIHAWPDFGTAVSLNYSRSFFMPEQNDDSQHSSSQLFV